MLSLSTGNTDNKICCFQKNQIGRKMWSQCISFTWQVLPLVGYCTVVESQTSLNMSMCQWAGRVPLAWGKWRFGLALHGKGFGFFVCIHCSPVERQEHFFPLPTFLRLLLTNRRFSVAETTSAQRFSDAWFGSCISQAAQSMPRCVWAHRDRPASVQVRLLLGRCCFQGSLFHAVWVQVSPHAQVPALQQMQMLPLYLV